MPTPLKRETSPIFSAALGGGGCGLVVLLVAFIIFISNGPAGDNSSSLSVAQAHLAGLVGKNPPDTLTISPNGEQGLWADEYAKFMSNSDCNATFDGVQNVYTYTLDVLPGSSGQGPSHTAQLKSMACSS